jgi:hypothetical protein
MPHHIEKHPTLPIVIRRYDDASLNLSSAASEPVSEDTRFIGEQSEKVYYLLDLREIHVGLDEVMKAGSLAAQKNSSLSSPNIIETLVVVPNRLLEMAAQGLRTATFGHMRVRAFRTMEDAIAYVEEKNAHQGT